MTTINTLSTLRKRRALLATVFGVLIFGGVFFDGWILEHVGWIAYGIFALIGVGILIALELRLRRVRCPDCGQPTEPKPGGTPSQYYCPKCGVVWDTEFRKAV